MKAASSVWAKGLIAALVLMSVSSMAVAATDVTGTWTFTQARGGRGGGGGGGGGGAGGGAAAPARVSTLKLKQSGEKVTGTLQMPAFGRRGQDAGADAPPPPPPVEIKNGKIAGDTLSFEVTRETPNGEFTTKYSGKVEGDKIVGETERPGRNGGDPVKTPWTATRAKDSKDSHESK